VHAVVIDRLQGDAGSLAKLAADVLGGTAYDYRASLNAHGPAVLRVLGDPREAEAVRAALERAGFHASVVAVRGGDPHFEARQFVLGEEVLEVENRTGTRRRVPYSAVDLLLRASAVSTVSTTKIVEERKFSLGRSLMSGGLVNTRVQRTKKTTRSTDSDEILFIYDTDDSEPVVMAEKGLLYQSLGSKLAPSRAANFLFVVDELRRRCARAGFDERLRQRPAQAQTLGRTLSPEDHLHFAAALVAASVRGRRPFAAFR
jgi:hypothetical protein